jgi:predicted ATPase
MRLDKLKIASFKNLRDFAVDFDEQSPTTVLVGRNGTGKSNLLEALTIIFRDLDLGVEPSFDYVLEYLCRGRKVRIEAIPRERAKATVGGVAVPYKQLGQGDGQPYLPTSATTQARATEWRSTLRSTKSDSIGTCWTARISLCGPCSMQGRFTANLSFSRFS